MGTMCIQGKTLCPTLKGWKLGYLVFHRKRLGPRVLPWQHLRRCHSLHFVMHISGAKFEEHCSDKGKGKGITSSCHASAIADHVTSTGHNLKWDLFEILAKGRSDTHCKIKETLLIQELKPTLNDTVSSEKLYLY